MSVPVAVTMGLGIASEILGIVNKVSLGQLPDEEGQQLIRDACGNLKAADVGLGAVLAENDRASLADAATMPEPGPVLTPMPSPVLVPAAPPPTGPSSGPEPTGES